jgi:twinkle protein
MLSPGKGRIMTWTGAKDPNDMLLQRRSSDFLGALNEAKVPDIGGVVTGEDAWAIIKDYKSPPFIPYPEEWEQLCRDLEGMREAEISMWTAGSGIGKTSMLRRIKQWVVQQGSWIVADIELEEKIEKTIRGMLEFQGRKKLKHMTSDEKRAAHDATYGTGRIITLNHRSQAKGAGIMPKLSYLHHALGAKLIFLDHITLGAREFGEGNSAQADMMEQMLAFVERTGVHLALISHLRKSPSGGRSWAKGAVPTEEDMIGSSAIYQISADVIGAARNKQAENDYLKNCTSLHALKHREDGNTGPKDVLHWDNENRSLEPADYELYQELLAEEANEEKDDSKSKSYPT